ncbi:MAG TPA: hypothetical protein VL992_03480 [Tepidisphaeraceae bacterium]|nr:hypothetical protein [Tepidisphaeraceae bacterium]
MSAEKNTTTSTPASARPSGAPSWQQLQTAVRNDPRRTLIVMVLVAVLLVLWGRLLLDGKSPSEAIASLTSEPQQADTDSTPVRIGHRPQSGLSLSDWARQPVSPLNRNFFSVPYDDYPPDPNHPQTNHNSNADSANSLSSQADQLKERQILIENLREQASSLSLDGIVMGPNPKASIDGQLVGVGQDIGVTGFRIVVIEPTKIIVLSHGVRIELAMK